MFSASRHIFPCLCIGSLLFAASPAVSYAATENSSSQDAASDAQNWQSIDSGTRPAYAGIQGGTAPLTILRSSNGLLFAFTGQTGNDFTLVLRGNSANASSPRPKEQAQQPVAAEQNAGTQEAALSPEREEALSRVADEAHARHRTVASQEKTDAQQRGNAEAAGVQPPAAENKTAATALSGPAQEQASAPTALLAVPASASPQGKSLVETLSAPAGEAPVLIFASGDLASEISVSEAVVPFGLPLPGERVGMPPPPLPEIPPLNLRVYRSILYSRDNL